MSHIWMSHVTHMKASCHTDECVVSHPYMSHVIHIAEFTPTHLGRMNESCHTRDKHIWMSHVTHTHLGRMNKSCHTRGEQIWMSHVTHVADFAPTHLGRTGRGVGLVWLHSTIRSLCIYIYVSLHIQIRLFSCTWRRACMTTFNDQVSFHIQLRFFSYTNVFLFISKYVSFYISIRLFSCANGCICILIIAIQYFITGYSGMYDYRQHSTSRFFSWHIYVPFSCTRASLFVYK